MTFIALYPIHPYPPLSIKRTKSLQVAIWFYKPTGASVPCRVGAGSVWGGVGTLPSPLFSLRCILPRLSLPVSPSRQCADFLLVAPTVVGGGLLSISLL